MSNKWYSTAIISRDTKKYDTFCRVAALCQKYFAPNSQQQKNTQETELVYKNTTDAFDAWTFIELLGSKCVEVVARTVELIWKVPCKRSIK